MADPVQTYAAEQKSLQAEYDGKLREDIKVTAPREPEVNPAVWKDVEPVLYRGFLTTSAEINRVHFVFKSLNHHEYDLLRFSINLKNASKVDEFWSTLLAYCVFMVDGANILADRRQWLPKVAETFSDLPKQAKATILRHVSEVNRRASAAVTLTEAYAMEGVSRYRWMQLKGIDLTSVSVTGIEGTQYLGLNWAQQLWRALNLAEDRNEHYERDWENAKFLGSCFAGKGLQKIYAQDTDRRRKEKEERIARKDRILREIVLGEKVPDKTSVLPGAVVTAPQTVEELADQLQKDLRGEKDWHDSVIEEHEKRIQLNYQGRQRQQEAVAQESAKLFGDNNVLGESDLHGLTRDQVEERMRRAKQLHAQNAARRQLRPEMDEKTDRFLGKWGLGPEVTSEISTTDRDVSEAVPVVRRPPTPTTPFRRK
jgi:hypothetical protein